jgi:hypothetical protein
MLGTENVGEERDCRRQRRPGTPEALKNALIGPQQVVYEPAQVTVGHGHSPPSTVDSMIMANPETARFGGDDDQ